MYRTLFIADASRFFSDRSPRSESLQEMSVSRFRVPDNLDGDVLSRFVIQRSDHLTETALADHLQDLVSECTQVPNNLHRENDTGNGYCKKGEKKSAARNYRFRDLSQFTARV